jgi:hypothetical protein
MGGPSRRAVVDLRGRLQSAVAWRDDLEAARADRAVGIRGETTPIGRDSLDGGAPVTSRASALE